MKSLAERQAFFFAIVILTDSALLPGQASLWGGIIINLLLYNDKVSS
jgi:hypothetical protein